MDNYGYEWRQSHYGVTAPAYNEAVHGPSRISYMSSVGSDDTSVPIMDSKGIFPSIDFNCGPTVLHGTCIVVQQYGSKIDAYNAKFCKMCASAIQSALLQVIYIVLPS